MAMEIEYADIDTTDAPPLTEADAASVVNGDGNQEKEPRENQPDDSQPRYDTDAESNQEGAPTLDDEPAHRTPGPLAPDWMDRDQRIDFYDSCWAAEDQHDVLVSEAKEEHFDLAVKRSELENELKEIKADEKAALKNLKNLIKRGPNYPQPPSKIAEAVATGGERSAITVDDSTADTTWRIIPTADIINGIKGMGEKKADAIISLAPTLGDLEELRARAGIAHKPFATVLPKGVGGGMADEIEERILSAVAKHCAGVNKAEAKVVEDDAEAVSSETISQEGETTAAVGESDVAEAETAEPEADAAIDDVELWEDMESDEDIPDSAAQ